MLWRENRRRDRLYGEVKDLVGGDDDVLAGEEHLPVEARFRYII